MFENKKTYACVAVLLAGLAVYYAGGITLQELGGLYAIVIPLAIASLKAGQVAQTAKVVEQVKVENAKTIATVQRAEDRECADKP